MSEHLRALVVILALSVFVFAVARKPVLEAALSAEEYKRRWLLWIGITLIAFMAHDFWIYMVLTVALVVTVRVPQDDRFPIFVFLIFVVPMLAKDIPGFGGIRFIINIHHVRALALILLLPAYLVLRAQPGVLPFGRTWTDLAVICYVVLGLGLQLAAGDTFTNWSRAMVYQIMDILLPYYVASRSPQSIAAFRKSVMSFVLALLVLSPIAIFEFTRHWLLYNALPDALGVHFGFGNYLGRGDSLRAPATTGHPIALGYAAAVSLALVMAFRHRVFTKWHWWLAIGGLGGGLIAPVARGPWMGALAAVVIFLATGPDRATRAGKTLLLLMIVGTAVVFSPIGNYVIDKLPFIGTVDTENVAYRQRLIDVSIGVIFQNPFFGAFDFMSNSDMEQMRQGEGIIDIVNSYLAIALSGGLTSLALFTAVLVLPWLGVARRVRSNANKGSEWHVLGRALLAALSVVIVTIATVSSILIIPTVYWCLIGMCAAYVNHRRVA